ncbi:MAG TPA: LuxR C-terminal-related transcriptional regulator [Spirochaetia bacterium]|nr:LuxR C-terminal-related transcriptional regulator [Spirochaetia bacterium]
MKGDTAIDAAADAAEEMRRLRDVLTEREKELDCVYALSREFSRNDLSLPEILSSSVDIIRAALQDPDSAFVHISVLKSEAASGLKVDAVSSFSCEIPVHGRESGTLSVSYGAVPAKKATASKELLEREEKLIQSVASLLGGVIDLRLSEFSARKAARTLKRKNVALREVLSQIEHEKRSLKDQVSKNIESFVLPLTTRLIQSGISTEAQELVNLLTGYVKDLTSPLGKTLTDPHLSLSLRETEICGMIRSGMSSKDIARVLNISLLTVERHRHNIRKKLGIDSTDVNLSTFLQQNSS